MNELTFSPQALEKLQTMRASLDHQQEMAMQPQIMDMFDELMTKRCI